MAVMGEMMKIKKELDRPICDPACERRKLRELKLLAKKSKVPWELLEPIFLWLFQKAKEEQEKLWKKTK
jgi:chorismate mutase